MNRDATSGINREVAIIIGDGISAAILASYMPHHGNQLHSLAHPIEFRCAQCDLTRESAMVATSSNGLVCPACYASFDGDDSSAFH